MKNFICGAAVTGALWCGMIAFLLWATCGFHAAQGARLGLGIVYQAADSVLYPTPSCAAGVYPDCGENQ
jgi:hypothetical protein